MSNDEVRSDGNGLAVSSRIVELSPSGDGGRAPTKLKRKETVLNDVTNTGVMAALIGGFALSCLQSTDFRLYESDHSTMDEIIYVLLVLRFTLAPAAHSHPPSCTVRRMSSRMDERSKRGPRSTGCCS